MSDIVQKVQVLIGGNAEQAKKVIKEVEDSMKASQQRMKAQSTNVGKDMGDQMGKAFSQAQDKWLKVAEGSLRQYGGRVGRVIADIIGQFDRIGKARDASRRLSNLGGQGTPTNTGLSAVEIAAATAAGSSLANGGGQAIGRTVKSVVKRGKFAGLPLFGSTSKQQFAERTRAYGLDRGLSFLRAHPHDDVNTIPDSETLGSYKDFRKHFYDSKTGKGVQGLREAMRPRMMDKIMARSMMPVGIKGAIGGLAGGIGIGAGIIGAGIAGIGALASKAKENAETRKQINEAKELIDTIESIQDPVKQTQRVIEEFGENGLEKFRELKDSTKELQESLGSEGWQNAADKAAVAWMNIKDTFSSIIDPIIEGAGKLVNGVMSYITGMTDEMVEESRRVEASIQKNIRLAQQIKEKRASAEKKADEEKKKRDEELLKAIQREKEETNSLLRDQIDLEQQKVDLENITAQLGEKKNRTLEEEYNYRKAINELIKVDSKLNEKRAKDLEDAQRAAEKEAEARERIADRSKLGISELAEKNTGAGRAASQVQSLEEAAKNARANGNNRLADRLSSQANALRGKLGAAGIIKSSEFGDEYPTDGMEAGPLSAEQLLETSRKGYGWIQGQQKQKSSDDYLLQGAVSKFGNRLGPSGMKLQDLARARQAELEGRKAKRGLNEFFIENGYVPMKAKNAK